MRNFRQITLFAVVVAAAASQGEAQQAWRWARNLDEARSLAAESNRLVLVHFSGSNCAPCQRLEKEVFAQPSFGEGLAADYVGVKINADLYPATARKFRVESWPTDVIITPDGEVVQRLISPRTISGYTATMAQIAADCRHETAIAASQYQRPVVNYGAVRSALTTAPPATVTADAPPRRYSAPTHSATDPVSKAGGNYAAPAATDSATTGRVGASSQPSVYAKQDRYADYYSRPPHEQAPPASPAAAYTQFPLNDAPPTVAAPAAAAVSYAPPQTTAVAPQPGYAPQPPTMATAAAMTAPGPVAPPGYAGGQPPVMGSQAVASAPRGPITQEQLPPGAAPLALDGHCPVALVEQQRWVLGDVRWGVTHEGRTYLFTSAADRDKFLQRPQPFAPVMAGNDPVLATDHGQMLAGKREHGLFVNGRVYLFVSEESLAQFERNRDRYVQSVNRTLR